MQSVATLLYQTNNNNAVSQEVVKFIYSGDDLDLLVFYTTCALVAASIQAFSCGLSYF